MTDILSLELFFHGFILTTFVAFSLFFILKDEISSLNSSSPQAYIESVVMFMFTFFQLLSQIVLNRMGLAKPSSVLEAESGAAKPTNGARTFTSALFSILIFFAVVYTLGTIASSLAKSWINAEKEYQLNFKATWMTNFDGLDENFNDQSLMIRSFNRHFAPDGAVCFALTQTTLQDSVLGKPGGFSASSRVVLDYHRMSVQQLSSSSRNLLDRKAYHLIRTDTGSRQKQIIRKETHYYTIQDRLNILRYIRKQSIADMKLSAFVSNTTKLVDYCEIFTISFFIMFLVMLINYIILSVRLVPSRINRMILITLIALITIINFIPMFQAKYLSAFSLGAVLLLCTLMSHVLNRKKWLTGLFPLFLVLLGFGGYFACSKACVLQKMTLYDGIFENYTPPASDPAKIQVLYTYMNYTDPKLQ